MVIISTLLMREPRAQEVERCSRTQLVSGGAGIQTGYRGSRVCASRHYSMLPLIFFFKCTHLFNTLKFFVRKL